MKERFPSVAVFEIFSVAVACRVSEITILLTVMSPELPVSSVMGPMKPVPVIATFVLKPWTPMFGVIEESPGTSAITVKGVDYSYPVK